VFEKEEKMFKFKPSSGTRTWLHRRQWRRGHVWGHKLDRSKLLWSFMADFLNKQPVFWGWIGRTPLHQRQGGISVLKTSN